MQYCIITLTTVATVHAGKNIRSAAGNRKQERQCTYDVSLRRVSTTIVVESKEMFYTFTARVSSPTYPSCNVYVPYCHLWPDKLYNIFPHYLINCTIFENKIY
jgi:hypothetical protein